MSYGEVVRRSDGARDEIMRWLESVCTPAVGAEGGLVLSLRREGTTLVLRTTRGEFRLVAGTIADGPTGRSLGGEASLLPHQRHVMRLEIPKDADVELREIDVDCVGDVWCQLQVNGRFATPEPVPLISLAFADRGPAGIFALIFARGSIADLHLENCGAEPATVAIEFRGVSYGRPT